MKGTIFLKIKNYREKYKFINKIYTFQDIKNQINIENNLNDYLIFIVINNENVRYYIYDSQFDNLELYLNLFDIQDSKINNICYKYLFKFINKKYNQNNIFDNQNLNSQYLNKKLNNSFNEITDYAFNWIKSKTKELGLKTINKYFNKYGDLPFMKFLSNLFIIYDIDLKKNSKEFYSIYKSMENK